MARVVLIDDSDGVRYVLRRALEKNADIAVVGDANCGEDGLAVVAATSPDIAIVDGAMAGIDGAETIKRLLALKPQLHVVAYSGDASREADLLNAGAEEFVLKAPSVEELIGAVQRVSRMERTEEPR